MDNSTERYQLEIATIFEIKQETKDPDNKRLYCTLEFPGGEREENIPFYGGGIDKVTKFPHGVFYPPRKNQLVGVFYLYGFSDNPIACFPIPHPTTFDKKIEKVFYNNILDSIDEAGLFHFSGTRIKIKEDGKIELNKPIGMPPSAVDNSIEIEFKTGNKKVIKDIQNNITITMSPTGLEIKSGGAAITENMVLGNSLKAYIDTVITTVFNAHFHLYQAPLYPLPGGMIPTGTPPVGMGSGNYLSTKNKND